MASTATLSGLRKAAMLMVQMGKEDSVRLMAHLRETEVEELTAEIARLGTVDREQADEVLAEFHDMATTYRYAGQGGLEYARDLLEAALGPEAAKAIM